VRDHQVAARPGGALDDIQRGHHRGGDSCDRRLRLPGDDPVHGLFPPRDARLALDPIDHLGRRQRGPGLLRLGQPGEREPGPAQHRPS